MAQRQVPPVLASVLGPLREADEYQRLQLVRQRGVYNLLTGLPGFFFAFMFGNGLLGELVGPNGFPMLLFFLMAIVWTGFFASSFAPKWSLEIVRRRRPDWESALVDSSLVNRAMEKQFWLQAPLAFAGLLLLVAGVVASILLPFEFDFEDFIKVGAAVLVGGFSAALAIQSRRRSDVLVEWLYWLTVPLTALAWLAQPQDLDILLGLIPLAVVWQPLVAGILRLLAPRRWLIR